MVHRTFKVLRGDAQENDGLDCANHRGIFLVEHAGKVLLKVEFSPLSDLTDLKEAESGLPPP